jgi:hypothetical protein
MTSRGRRIAGVIAILAVLFLPKHVECGFPDATCRHPGPLHTVCTDYEVEPLGFYALEMVFGRDIGFAYSSGLDCH